MDNAVREYNKVITENRVYEPKLKNAELSGNILSKDVAERRQNIDKFLKDFKSEYKVEFENIETHEEEITKQLNQVRLLFRGIQDSKFITFTKSQISPPKNNQVKCKFP